MHNPHTARLTAADEARAAEIAKRLADEAAKRKAEFRWRLELTIWRAAIWAPPPGRPLDKHIAAAVMRFLEDEVRR